MEFESFSDDFKPHPSFGDITTSLTSMVVDAVISIIALIQKNDVLELDINPLIVLEEKKGAVAADVLIRLNSD